MGAVATAGDAIRTCGGRVRRRCDGNAHVLFEAARLVLEGLVPAEELLDSLVVALGAPELLELALKAIDVLLGPGPDGALGFSVVGPLACQL